MADQDETTLSIVFGVDEKHDGDANQQNESDGNDSTLPIIESVVKQTFKLRHVSGETESTADTGSTSLRTRIEDHRLQACFDHRGGPNFKDQANDRSIIGESVVRAQPANLATAPADFYGRVSQRRGRCIVHGQDDGTPVELVTAVECASDKGLGKNSKPRKHRMSRETHVKKKARTLADERRFWLIIIFLGTFLNVLLVTGATAMGLYLSGNFPGQRTAQVPPIPTPTPPYIGGESLSPSPIWPTDDAAVATGGFGGIDAEGGGQSSLPNNDTGVEPMFSAPAAPLFPLLHGSH